MIAMLMEFPWWAILMVALCAVMLHGVIVAKKGRPR